MITVHGLRDDHKTVWTSQTGKPWVKFGLFDQLSIRQLDYLYAIDEKAGVYSPDGIKKEARNLLRLYREERHKLPDVGSARQLF